MLDSANDKYPIYELCSIWNINLLINLNSKNKVNSKYPSTLFITKKGVPIYMDNHEIVYDGFEKVVLLLNSVFQKLVEKLKVVVLNNTCLAIWPSNLKQPN